MLVERNMMIVMKKLVITAVFALILTLGSISMSEGFSFDITPTIVQDDGVVVAFESMEYSIMAGKVLTVKPVIQNYSGKTSYSIPYFTANTILF